MKRVARALLVLFLTFALFFGWYAVASNYDCSALAGTYTFHQGGVSCVLQLAKGGTFAQALQTTAGVKRTSGKWRRTGMAGVDFSDSLLRLPGARTAIEEWPESPPDDPGANMFYGHFRKVLGVYPELELNANPPVLTFRKCLLNCPAP